MKNNDSVVETAVASSSLPVRIYRECFPTFHALADSFLVGLSTRNVSRSTNEGHNIGKSKDCAALGRVILQPSTNLGCVAHLARNYAFYVKAE